MTIREDVEGGQNSLQKDEIREPLIIVESKELTNEDGYEESSPRHEWMVYFSTFVAVCGSFAFGTCVGYSSPTQSGITNDLDLSLAEYSLFGSILTFGGMVGAIISGPLADFFGRKGAMRISSGLCAAGWLAIFFAKDALSLDIGRLATGFGMGIFSFVVPVFISEIAPKNLRGALATLNQVMICTGASVSFSIGTVLTWRILALVGVIPCSILLFGLLFIPESPRWLAKMGRQKEFEVALQRLRGKDADISKESVEIQEYIESLDQLPKAHMLDLFQRRYLHSIIIGVGLMVCQQLGGINGVGFYLTSIFDSAGFPSDLGTIIFACIQVPITVIGALLIDRAGRKPLLLVSGSGLVIGCGLTALSFYFKVHEIAPESTPVLAASGILVYIASFSIGLGAVPWVVMSEIFPINVKGVAGSLATLVNWFIAWLVSYTFNYLMAWSSYGTFILYGGINALAIVFIIRVVPETKGKSLEQIQAAMNS